ncbi:MAG: ATP-binding protein [Dysgonamonadaceae bacterium]|jgi:hypothetical protein|nr:ATP-binding protein [Dysgonamonadaceae bacterium]
METKKIYKRLPYGISDFRRIIRENYAYVDKTKFIEMLENETNPNQFFIRPRKFGKSLFFTTLFYYYDLREAENFDTLFGDFYIGKHPTPERNSYAVMKFDFSGMDTTSEEGFKSSFSSNVQSTVRNFLRLYESVFPEADSYVRQIDEEKPGLKALEKAFAAAEQNHIKLFFIIDEYDHFANDLIAMGNRLGKDLYKAMVAANGMVRDFYERIKMAAKSSIINRTFITGVSPVMLDDLTSGYNIATILTLNPKYNEMMGFTQEEVEWLMKVTGVDANLIQVDIEAYYNGYLFHVEGKHTVYNPAMVLYFFNQIIDFQVPPKNIIDQNLKTDYGRLRRLIQNENNREALIQIIKDGSVIAEVLEKFSIDRMNDNRYFISLLFYMGLLTIREPYFNKVRLEIPNYSIRTLYWEYLTELIEDTSPLLSISHHSLDEAVIALAMEGNLEGFIEYVSQHAFSKLSDHDLQHFDEKYIKVLLLAYLFMSKIYVPMSEYEAVPGRADMYLQRSPLLPQVKYEWIFELKYCKTGASEAEIAAQQQKGKEQIEQYRASHRLGDRSDMKAAVIVFIGKNKYRIAIL